MSNKNNKPKGENVHNIFVKVFCLLNQTNKLATKKKIGVIKKKYGITKVLTIEMANRAIPTIKKILRLLFSNSIVQQNDNYFFFIKPLDTYAPSGSSQIKFYPCTTLSRGIGG